MIVGSLQMRARMQAVLSHMSVDIHHRERLYTSFRSRN